MSGEESNVYPLSKIANLVKDYQKSAECAYFVALCEVMDAQINGGVSANLSPAKLQEGPDCKLDPILLLYDTELRLLK